MTELFIKQKVLTMKKILIAYYSRRGENYLNGAIVNLPIGNTEVVAQKIEKLTNGDMFRIDTLQQYPGNYMTSKGESSQQSPQILNTMHINFLQIGDR